MRRRDPEMDMTDHSVHAITPYRVISVIILIVLTILFIFPLYWIVTGSFKTQQAINARVPVWFPVDPTLNNYERLFQKPAFTWLFNTVLVCTLAMGFTCITASMGGYALAKKRFTGRKLLFSMFVCAMALPKQVILIPLLKEMAFLKLHNTLWAVIFPTVGWPFGVFLMKQFSEGIPNEMLEASRIDGAGETRTFISIILPMIKPGIGALAIFTFITAWNDYFLQLIMLNDTKVLTISLGIAKLQSELSTDFGLIMAGAALGSIPIIIIFLLFQKFFTRGITMGAVKG
ncbi:MAG: carbohydrate ABC transporter permease [Clostridia bacterium]|nr:carbohydrate ABC transporter permease [Clostridia bacterium]